MTELARTYGGALYELAREERLSEGLLGELDMCVKLLEDNPAYARLLSTPSVSKEERRELIKSAFSGRVHVYVESFLKLLVDRDAVGELSGCARAYRMRYNEDNGILEVTATAAVDLDKTVREKLTARLREVFGKKIVLTVTVDPSVLGGMRLECAGRRYDGTVKDRLARIERGLRETVL